MLNKINPIVKDISVPGIRVFANKVSEYSNGINLTIGQPDFPTPTRVKDAGIKAIENNLTGYSHNAGLLPLREAVSNFFHEKYGFLYDPYEEIIITNGASEAIDSVLRTIITPGDEVILPIPSYSGYESIIQLSGGKIVTLDTTKTNFIPDPDDLEKIISSKTKAIILNFPSNPVGVSLRKEQIEPLVRLLSKHKIFILSDEIYSENVFDFDHISFASYPEIRPQLLLLHGLSKSHAMTGWRLGYVLGDQKVIEQVLKVHLNNSICASLPSQYAAIDALNNCRNAPENMNRAYIERRDYVYNRLTEMGLHALKPNGTFYIFPSIQHTKLSSLEFATRLLEEQYTAVVPGSAFRAEDYIRISFANSMENIKEGLDRIEAFIYSLK
ncbi:aminotransferase class I/II-fold pyridoxal phosphate-dependent enzyme [Sporosarcina pasteurii]|uniref:Aminotransferase n=1 Tax=Sporosarcina pasteurii TaxID=1474 RepID=A0A380C2X6_SPOPA|nr:aminotransferase class I/II-fold pyridoxal phosphate-dependent enzyme [Sporosarcina pasteurii]MDS9471510.1 aminotransferase class I/II-fold pyridoxal phosphate-dependent enzyme [Sporosarcina pasteurii]QBQ04870.1 aminotransferase class I/II-fold pyridoxal phosphate-dependent enzyme [Sporosarcina pasteurii]SUJ10613.1 Putative aminotransferase A [Sporosarcina pasteurii]